jgi:predicted exporter
MFRFTHWPAFILGPILVLAIYGLHRGVQLESSFLKLLPEMFEPSTFEKTAEKFDEVGTRQLVILIHHPEPAIKRAVAESWSKHLLEHGDLDLRVGLQNQKRGQEIYELYFPHRWTLPLLGGPPWSNSANIHKFLHDRSRDIFSGISPMIAFEKDPLLLFQGRLDDMTSGLKFSLEEGWPAVQDQGKTYLMLVAQLKTSAMDGAVQTRLITSLNQWSLDDERAHGAALEIHRTGAVFFAHSESMNIQKDIAWIGSIALLGVSAIFLLAFGSMLPLLKTWCSIGLGIGTGLGVTQWWFGEVHLVTLGFGSTLTGIAVDYAFHLLFQPKSSATIESSARPEHRKLVASLLLGWGTTSLALIVFCMAPLPVIRQMAVFIVVGLGTSLCFSILVFRTSSPSRLLSIKPWVGWASLLRLHPLIALVAWVVLLVILASTVHYNDNIRSYGNPAEELLTKDRWIQRLSGGLQRALRCVIVAENLEQRLVREEELCRLLASESHPLRPLTPPPSFWMPSSSIQTQILKDWQVSFGDQERALDQYGSALGLQKNWIEEPANELKNSKILLPATVLDSPLGRVCSDHQFQIDGLSTSVILLPETLTSAQMSLIEQLPWAKLVDRVSNINEQLRHYREQILLWFISATFILGALNLVVFGWRNGLRIALPPQLAVALTWIVLVLVDPLGINLFHLLASLLIWGVGIDYAILFTRHHQGSRSVTMANLCSAITTLLSFGLLVISHSPVLQSLGLTVFIGVFLALFFAWWMSPRGDVFVDGAPPCR